MIELTAEQRMQVYLEEKKKMKSGGKEVMAALFISSVMAGFFLTALLRLSKSELVPKLEDLRKAYPGIDPESEEYR
jgi:hypothetical protein